jgi:endoglucanase
LKNRVANTKSFLVIRNNNDQSKLAAQSCEFPFTKGVKSFLLLFTLLCFTSVIDAQNDPIRLNQVGYYPNSTKLAIVTGKVRSQFFSVVTSDGLDTVYEGSLSLEKKSSFSSTLTRIADFTDFQQVGSFRFAY